MKRLRKWLPEFFRDLRAACRVFRSLRRRRPPAPPKIKDKRIPYRGRVLQAPVEAPWPKNINEILNDDGSPKPPWKEL